MSHRASGRILLQELDGLQGRPDLVVANIRALPCGIDLDSFATSLTSPTKARILSLLRYKSPRRRNYLSSYTGISLSRLADHVRELERTGLVAIHRSSSVSLNFPLPWEMVDVATYELKLSNWRRALHQAMCYRSFSHRVWVVMPTTGAHHAQKLKAVFQIQGIGLISVDRDGVTHIEIRGKKRRPASRRLYLMAVGEILKNFLKEGRRLHRRLRPESIQCL